MARLESGATDGVVVFDIERFSRQALEGERLIAAAERGLRVLDSDAEYDLISPSGRKAFRDQMTSAAYYSDRLSSRVKRGKRIKAASGAVDRKQCYGFDADGVTVRPDEAEVIRECAERLLGGEPQMRIAADLNERGVPAPSGRPWTSTAIRCSLLRPRNAGLIVHDGEVVDGVRLPAAILDETTWRRVVAMYSARRPGRPPSGRYMLTGFLYCELCGHTLGGRPQTGTYRDGTQRRQYWCATSAGGCGRIMVDCRAIDAWAGGWAIRELSDPAHASAMELAERELEARRSGLADELAEVDALIMALDERLGRRELTLERYERIVKPLEADRERVRLELDELAGADVAAYSTRLFTPREAERFAWLVRWDEGDTVERRGVVKLALRGRRVVVGRGRPGAFDAERVRVV
jgi:hypothetical protein